MSFPIVSSNTLFNFKKKREYLINILANNFRPRYSLENLGCLIPDAISPDDLDIAIPMICFCDLPLSNIRKHLLLYGKYGIGLTKEWGKRKGLNPILYVHQNSNVWKAIDESGLAITKYLKPGDVAEELMKGLTTLRFNYLKPYEGDFLRDGEIIRNVRFYDEREWRFVPQPPNGEYYRLRKEEFMNLQIQQDFNNSLPESATLEFTPNDVRYIIVEREDEILEMMDDILRIMGNRYTDNQLRILTTRIISAQQILEDF